jgi:hypothetical protein
MTNESKDTTKNNELPLITSADKLTPEMVNALTNGYEQEEYVNE